MFTGTYVCSILHESGVVEASGVLEVVTSRGPPTLLFEPYDLDAYPGTTIELPCRGEGDPTPQVKCFV